jgi:hypothetical protein
MAFYLRWVEANKRETLSLSLRLRVARARAADELFGIGQVSVKFLFSFCQVIVQA